MKMNLVFNYFLWMCSICFQTNQNIIGKQKIARKGRNSAYDCRRSITVGNRKATVKICYDLNGTGDGRMQVRVNGTNVFDFPGIT